MSKELTAEQQKRVREFVKAAEQDARFRKEALEKLGFKLPSWLTGDKLPEPLGQKTLWHAYRMVPQALAGAGVAAVGGAAISGARALADKSSMAYSYRNMLKNNPELAEEDATSAQRAFKTLYRLNPEYAKDPLIAGTFVGNTLRAESLHMGDLNQLVQARRAMAQGPDNFFSKAVSLGGDLEKMRSSLSKDVREGELHPSRMVEAEERAAAANVERERQEDLHEDLRKNLGKD